MAEPFGRVIAVILAVIMLALQPLPYLAVNQEAVMDSHVEAATREFADNIMLNGYITLNMYNDYYESLGTTGQLYDIEMVHSKQVDGYETGRTDNGKKQVSSTGENGTFSAMEMVLGKHTLTMPNFNSDGVVQSLSTHTHTDACYAGHRHSSSCYGESIYEGTPITTGQLHSSTSFDSTQYTGYIDFECDANSNHLLGCLTYHYNYGTDIYSDKIDSINLIEYYLKSDNTLAVKTKTHYKYLESNDQKDGWTAVNKNGTTVYRIKNPEWDKLYDEYYQLNDFCLLGNDKVYYYGYSILEDFGYNPQYSCPFCMQINTKPKTVSCDLICDIPEDNNPICDRVVTDITATKQSQSIIIGDDIISTATATYLDGHTGTVNCTVTGFDKNKIGIQTVTFTYSGLVDNAKTTGTKTCTTTVTVNNKNKPVSLTVTPSSDTVYNGSEPTYEVKVNYDDNTSKIITSGYTKTGFTAGAGTKTVKFSYTENGVTVSTEITIIVKRNVVTCPYGHIYELDDFDNDNGCPVCKKVLEKISVAPNNLTVEKGGSLSINITATYQDGHTEVVTDGWTSDFDSSKLGYQLVTITYKNKKEAIAVTVTKDITCPVCGTVYAADADGSDPGCPVCKKKVVSITATPDNQVVEYGNDLTLQVTATYQDGHSENVDDWTSNFDTFSPGEQTVTVYYETRSTSVKVTVDTPEQVKCPVCGMVYNPLQYPNGCPYCSTTVTGIEAALRDGGTKVQYGSELNLNVILLYKDGHRALAFNDWSVEGYHAKQLGTQTITVNYKNFSTSLTIEVINTLLKKVCPNGHVYYLNADGSDPGCPYCNQDTTTDSAQSYMDCIYTARIMKVLYDKGIYYLDDGDFITVTVKQKNTSIYYRLKHLFHRIDVENKKYSYGGMVDYGQYI